MTGLDQRLWTATHGLERSVTPSPPPLGDLVRRAARRRQRAGLALAALALAGLVPGVASLVQDRRAEGDRILAGPGTDRTAQQNAGLLMPGEWRTLPAAPIAGRFDPASVWSGREFILWGGATGAAGDTLFDDGAAYDPGTDAWRTLPDSPLTARSSAAAVWTGREMVIWGGGANGATLDDGAAYDPAAGTWRPLATAPITGGVRPSAVWSGREMIVVGGINAGPAAASYDPVADEWRRLEAAPGGSLPPYPQAVWAGDRAAFVLRPPFGTNTNLGVIATFDPKTETWSELPAAGVEAPRLVWTGDVLVAVSARPGGTSASFDFAADRWSGVAVTPAEASAVAPPVWTGGAVLSWRPGQALVLDLTGRRWQTDATAGELTLADNRPLVWADGVVLAWGGQVQSDGSSDGVMYRPLDLPGPSAPRAEPAALPTPTTLAPRVERVLDRQGRSRGRVDLNGPAARWEGRTVAAHPVLDDGGNLVGYFGCRFFERSEVEKPGVDLMALCPTPTTRSGPPVR